MNTIVIDANISLSFVIPLPYSLQAMQAMNDWRQEQARIVAPTLWYYEVLSGVRKSIALGILDETRAGQALEQLKAISIEEIPMTWETSELALDWARRIDQVVAYDAIYLATAEQLSANFWTADKRLYKTTQRLGIGWVKWVGI
jgi:predicted nucleic acid-binding protein